MSGLVLSLFSGLGALDEGFRQVGYCVVSAGDVAWSSLYDVRRFHPPVGVFEGVIGGDPCQSHSSLANLVRAKGLEPSFPDMTPELVRVVEEARPRWFLRENVPKAPDPKPLGYDVQNFLLDHSTMDAGEDWGHEQMRKRRFWFGVRDGKCPELRAYLDFAWFVLPETAHAVDAGHDYIDGQKLRRTHATTGGGAWVGRSAGYSKRTASVTTRSGKPPGLGGTRKQSATGRHHSNGMGPAHPGNPPRYSLDEMLDLQGLPRDVFEHSPFTMQGKRKLVGNAVPGPMAIALGRAVRAALDSQEAA